MGGGYLPEWDTWALAIPFLVILGMALCGLDERLASSRRKPRADRSFCGVDRQGRSFLSDPDGSPWMKKAQQIERRVTCSPAWGRLESKLGCRKTPRQGQAMHPNI